MAVRSCMFSPRPWLLIIGSSVYISGCAPEREKAQNLQTNVNVTATKPRSAKPVPRGRLNRSQVLKTIAGIASAFAAGRDVEGMQQSLEGRAFTFPIRFGCSGPSDDEKDGMAWKYDPATKALQVRVTPSLTAEVEPSPNAEGAVMESVQGFWVPQPWLLEAACPQAREAPAHFQPAPEVGLAQFFNSEDSRVEMRSRPFSAVQRVDETSIPKTEGFSILLSGRFHALPSGRTVQCSQPHREARPICIASVKFDKVVVRNEKNGSTVAEWSIG